MTDRPTGGREALAAALEVIETMDWLPESDDEVIESSEIVTTAARERLAQLPEKCENCEGNGTETYRTQFGPRTKTQNRPCPTCHGSGTVYPAELVERIALALADREFTVHDAAVAVLDALNTETV